jgi:ribosome-associated protein
MEFELEDRKFIELNKLLKILNMAESGGHASRLITEGMIVLNGEIETRKRKKLFKGDVVVFDDTQIKIV